MPEYCNDHEEPHALPNYPDLFGFVSIVCMQLTSLQSIDSVNGTPHTHTLLPKKRHVSLM